MFGFSWTNHASISRGEERNTGYESFRVHTQKKGRNVYVKQNLPPLKHGKGGCGPGVGHTRLGSEGDEWDCSSGLWKVYL